MNELNSYPTCHDDILEYEIVFFLCSLRYEECATKKYTPKEENGDDPEEQIDMKMYNCLNHHLGDMNQKDKCIKQAMTAPAKPVDNAMVDQSIQRYCSEAVKCKSFKNMDACMKKYHSLYEFDQEAGDCSTQHQVALQAEFEMLHELVEHNHCKTIKKAESYTRVEDIIAKSKTVQEFSDKISGNSKLNYAIGDDYFEFASSKDFDSANIAKQKFVDNWGEYLVCRHKKFLLSL